MLPYQTEIVHDCDTLFDFLWSIQQTISTCNSYKIEVLNKLPTVRYIKCKFELCYKKYKVAVVLIIINIFYTIQSFTVRNNNLWKSNLSFFLIFATTSIIYKYESRNYGNGLVL